MVMYLRGMTPDLVATDDDGNVLPGVVGTIHASVGGTVYTNTFACDTTTLAVGAATGGTVTADSIGRFAFYTENFAGTLWLKASGKWWVVEPSKTSDIVTGAVAAALTPFDGRVTAVEVATEDQDTRLAVVEGQTDDLADDVTALDTRVDNIISPISVKAFGALGDGTTDDRNAFAAAIAVIETAGGGELYIPPGTYVVNGVVELCSNLSIRGDGAVITKTNWSPYAVFAALSHGAEGYGSSVKHVRVSGLKFLGDFDNDHSICGFALHHASDILIEQCVFEEAQGTGHCIDLCGCDQIVVRGCDFLGFNNHLTGGFNRAEAIEIDYSFNGFLSVNDDAGSYDGLPTKDVVVDNCRFLPITVSAVVYPCPNPLGAHAQIEGKAYSNITFSNNLIVDPNEDIPPSNADNSWVTGVIHFPTVHGLQVVGNTFTQSVPKCTRAICVVSRSHGVTAAANPETAGPVDAAWGAPVISKSIVIRDNTFRGFKPLATTGTEIPTIYVRGVSGGRIEGCSVDGNVITDGYQATGALGGRAIFLQEITRSSVARNSIYSHRYGIDVSNAEAISIEGNVIDQMYNWPIVLTAAVGIAILGNAMTRLRKPIQAQSDCTDVSVIGNAITNPQVTGVDAAGIVMSGNSKYTVQGNVITNTTSTQQRGIAVGTGTDGTVVDNMITGYTTKVERPATMPARCTMHPNGLENYTSAARPTPASAGIGTMIYNTTVNKPNWSTGSAWVDGAGTAVP